VPTANAAERRNSANANASIVGLQMDIFQHFLKDEVSADWTCNSHTAAPV
jgi:hypothetical protein